MKKKVVWKVGRKERVLVENRFFAEEAGQVVGAITRLLPTDVNVNHSNTRGTENDCRWKAGIFSE
jgi:hypothetical protein